ncbi:AAA family ATPase [Methylobacterium oryzihabitans]|uniref:DNA repair protein n=1 Tax=Methylobacterium oryzihabitans TaxID=2499852 RepID=A0A3S2YUR7_9HYPH|nr:AAA family ATPase [Methylobacterium oryzihabitans]RVU19708.1 DNA repair protein [Methylobacterium oryzihabitans]
MRADEAADAVARLGRALAGAEARRDAVGAAIAARAAVVAEAKGRLAQRDAVDACLRDLQQDAHQRSLASFETLLTALVQEVLPGEKPVSLELATERGLPALDIGLMRPDGGREDVLEDNGGAMTNVVGMALRLIAVVKAGVGRFLALDEADCWIAPDRVPAFYRVLEDGAARLGVQCLAISHHDLGAVAAGMAVSRVAGRPATGVAIDGPAAACAAAWAPDQPGFRFVRLVDVQGFADATLPLGPGVNALIGPNNTGKSTVIRALRAVFYGEARDGLVRAGATAARIEIGVAGGRTLRFVRQPRRSPVNLWSLHEPDGSLAVERGARLETGGRDVPDWVDRLFGIRRVEDLDLHVAHQKFPVFLLGEKPAKRSAVLSIGREAGIVRDMQAIQRERVIDDQRTVREGEREITRLREVALGFADLDGIALAIDSLRRQAGALAQADDRLRRIEARAAGLGRLSAEHRAAGLRDAAFAGLPDPEAAAALGRTLAEDRHRVALGERLLAASRDRRAAEARAAILAALPSREPVPAGYEAAALLAATGGRCPACGAPAAAAHLLDGHRASPGEAA